MKPNDDNGHLPPAERPYRVLLLAGSQRRQFNCPGVDSKARMLMLRMAERLPQDWEVDYEDLANVYGRPKIQSCNACVSTSMALCVWPCNCYERGSKAEPDLMWELDLYSRLDLADAWAIIGPVNWYAPSTNLKLMFDRLVCMNGGNPREDLIKHKDAELAGKLEHSAEWHELSVNHLEGRTASVFCYTDDGADETGPDERPKLLRHKAYFDPEAEPFDDDRQAFAPLVWQMRYSGIEVPDLLWDHGVSGAGVPYSDNQAEDMIADGAFIQRFDAWTDRFSAFVAAKGKVQPGQYRAFGYEAPGHMMADLRLKWRELRISMGRPRAGSSPDAQQDLGLNKDTTFRTKEGEGRKLRSK
jgi:hypothetical protein